MNRFVLTLTLLGIVSGGKISAQFGVHEGLSPENLVGNVLLGPGVEVFDIQFNGGDPGTPNVQMAGFSGGGATFGLESGIILATGGAAVAEGPNDYPSAHIPLAPGTSLHEEPDLEFITSPAAIRDAAVLSFSFVAQGDMLSFRYVFASEEYNEYTCSVYNDVFGFFISGPGITPDGPFENGARNLALIPGTNVPVAINTVNQGFEGSFGSPLVCHMQNPDWEQHSQYYVNNENVPVPYDTQFDGFTHPFIVEVPVICGETYHIKLAIADVVDDKNDSAVLIEANSFSSPPPLLVESTVINPDSDGRLVEGCSSLYLKLNRTESGAAETVFLRTRNLENTQNLLPDLPESLTFYPNQSEIEWVGPLSDDAITQGERDFLLDILQTGVCAVDTSRTTLELMLTDSPPLVLDYSPFQTVDCNDPTEIAIEVSGGYPPYTVEWNHPDAQGLSFEMHTDQELMLQAHVTDLCNVHEATAEIVLHPETFSSLEVIVVDSMSFGCTEPILIQATVSGGAGNPEFLWTQDGELVSESNPFYGIPQSESPLQLTVSDRCAPPVQASVLLNARDNPLFVSLGPDTIGQCNEALHILPDVYGGEGTLSYYWTASGLPISQSPLLTLYPKHSQPVKLTVMDACGRIESDSMWVLVDSTPPIVVLEGPMELCSGEMLQPDLQIIGGTPPMSVIWKLDDQPVDLPKPIYENSRLGVVVTDDCDSKAESSLALVVHEVEAAFEIDYDRANYPFVNTSTTAADMVWTFSDGTSSEEFSPRVDARKEIVGPVMLEVTNALGCTDAVSLFFEPPMHLYFPNAFTPDGDGLNDLFKAEGRDIASFHLIIFDRWGRVVFETDNPDEGWNGNTPGNSAHYTHDTNYTYRFRAQSLSGEWKEGVGSVMLLR